MRIAHYECAHANSLKTMITLAIETSCDDTCVAIVKSDSQGHHILANIISSQVEIHRGYGGVYPSLAKREHQKNLVPVLMEALSHARILRKSKIQSTKSKINPKSKIQNLRKILEREKILYGQLEEFLKKHQKPGVDLIAVTIGPGLEPCLWVGVNFAKALALSWNLPIIPVNHIEGHIFANFVGFPFLSLRGVQSQFLKKTGAGRRSNLLNLPFEIASSLHSASPCSVPRNDKKGVNEQLGTKSQKLFPAICLLVSGGHTQLILMRNFGKYKILGETRDDAAGECFDKVARILGLGYPGGPAIAAEATKFSKEQFFGSLPRPMIYQKNYDFSFSGLKTAVLYNYKSQTPKVRKSKKYIQAVCAETQQAIVDVLIHKTLQAAKEYKAKTIMLGGGVSANKELRQQMAKAIKKNLPASDFRLPTSELCTDNAAMIAIAAYYYARRGDVKTWRDIKAEANLRLV